MSFHNQLNSKASCRPATGWIYGLVDPRTNWIRYVGKTMRPEVRKRQHQQPRKSAANLDLEAWKAELFAIGECPTFIILAHVTASARWLLTGMLADSEIIAIHRIELYQLRHRGPQLLNAIRPVSRQLS